MHRLLYHRAINLHKGGRTDTNYESAIDIPLYILATGKRIKS